MEENYFAILMRLQCINFNLHQLDNDELLIFSFIVADQQVVCSVIACYLIALFLHTSITYLRLQYEICILAILYINLSQAKIISVYSSKIIFETFFNYSQGKK